MNILNYRGYAASVEFDAEDKILVGRIAGINDVISFHGDNGEEIEAAFIEAVEDYIDTCNRIKKAPERPYSGKVMLRVKPKVHAKAALAAQLKGISLNQFGEDALLRAADHIIPREDLEMRRTEEVPVAHKEARVIGEVVVRRTKTKEEV